METSDLPYLRPCKQLPSPTSDRESIHTPMGQQIGIPSWSQDQIEHEDTHSSVNSCVEEDDLEDEGSEIEQKTSEDVSDPMNTESLEKKATQLAMGEQAVSAMTTSKNEPMRLLDLPLDILKVIFKEVGLRRFGSALNGRLTIATGIPHHRFGKLRESELDITLVSYSNNLLQI